MHLLQQKISRIIDRLYDRLMVAFQETTLREQVEQALKVLRFLTLWKGRNNAEYIKEDTTIDLFKTILDSGVEDNLKWDAARLVMQIGFRERKSGLLFGSARIFVTFLEHHLVHEPHNHDYIADAFHALTLHRYIPVRDFNLKEENLVRGICSALEDPSYTGRHCVLSMISVTESEIR
jgi:hypothetical protein